MNSVHEQLVELLKANNARFRLLEHPAEGRSDQVAAIRGTSPEQGAKAMTCEVKLTDRRQLVLAVLPGNLKIDMKKLGQYYSASKARFLEAALAQELTQCVIGAIPPFAFNKNFALVVDRKLIESNSEIAFNAGRLDFSIVLNVSDYLRIANPNVADISAS